MPSNTATAIPNTVSSTVADIRRKDDSIPLRPKAMLLDKNFLPQGTDFKTGAATETQPSSEQSEKEPTIVSLHKAAVSGWQIPREEKLQEWEGQVVSIDWEGATFTAHLTDLTAGDNIETEEGDFPLSDLSDSDMELLEEGAIFRWIVGYKYNGTSRERFSRVSFRNLPRWSKAELDAADRDAERLNAIEWD
jgi:hypothetical protein